MGFGTEPPTTEMAIKTPALNILDEHRLENPP
jgi:hypothetical protein